MSIRAILSLDGAMSMKYVLAELIRTYTLKRKYVKLLILTTTTMKAIIKIKRDNDVILIKYSNINKVYRQDLHITVECNEQYEVNDKELVRNNNCSTTPYKHVYYDATIVAAYQ